MTIVRNLSDEKPIPFRRHAVPGVLLAIIVIAAVLALRAYVTRRAEAAFINPGPRGSTTPGDQDIPFVPLQIVSGDRILHGWFVRAPDTSRIPLAVLVFHGNRVSIANQVDIVATFFERGMTSMVFDYSGFGASSGRATRRNLREDAHAAYVTFVDSAGPLARKFILGTSLGAAIALDIAGDIQTNLDGLIVVGTFGSSRDVGVRQGTIPRFLRAFAPELYDNVEAAGRFTKPLLVVHSDADELFPIDDARAIASAAGGRVRLEVLTDVGHEDYLTAPAHWSPVMAFIRGGS